MALNPYAPFHLILALLTIAYGIVALAAVWRQRSLRAVLTLSLAGAALLAWTLAAWNPGELRPVDAERPHLALVLDVSESVRRAEGGWSAVRDATAEHLAARLNTLEAARLAEGTASLITLQGETAAQQTPLSDAVRTLRGLSPGDFAGGTGSNLGAGLEAARAAIRRAGGVGAVILVSDGHDTLGEALKAADSLAQNGLRVDVLPVNSRQPALAISAANLSRQTAANSETILRGMVRNQSAASVPATLTIAHLSGDEARQTQTKVPTLAPDAYARLRLPLLFEEVGLQAVDVTLRGGSITHQRRFFTHVTRPLRLLALGGDVRFAGAIDPDVATILTATPDDFSASTDLSDYDGVIIADAPASQFDPAALDALAAAIVQDGLGLLMINGDHGAADEQAASMLRSYAETPLHELFPVTTDPRPFQPEPPPRQVVFFIDTSGSMSGWPLAKAQEIAAYIVQNLLRPQDVLDVVAFTTGSAVIVEQRAMDDAGKQDAMRAINALQAGGGTDPREALALIRDRQMSNCGLVFLSDGYFSSGVAEARPDCRATAFGIGRAAIPSGDPLFEIADPFEVGQDFDPALIDIPYFDPEERDKFYERGDYTPLSMAFVDPRVALDVPDLRLSGTAVTYPRDDESVRVIAVRPKFIDPVLAYREAERGTVGTFTTALPSAWLSDDNGRAFVQQMLLNIVAYSERERYQFSLEDDGAALRFEIMVRDPAGTPPRLDALSARILTADDAFDLPLRPVPGEVATYEGVVRPPRDDAPINAQLVLNERGPDAVSREQRLALTLPPAASVTAATTTEANSSGTNVALLQAIAAITGGRYAPDVSAPLFASAEASTLRRSFWRELVALGAVLYLLAIAIARG